MWWMVTRSQILVCDEAVDMDIPLKRGTENGISFVWTFFYLFHNFIMEFSAFSPSNAPEVFDAWQSQQLFTIHELWTSMFQLQVDLITVFFAYAESYRISSLLCQHPDGRSRDDCGKVTSSSSLFVGEC